jgi:hypothetical protein
MAQLPDSYSYVCIRKWIANFSSECEEESEVVVLDKEKVFQQGVR